MSQKFDHINASEPVSTVTKHIKIYSDNPIHDCIDRIINICSDLDEHVNDSLVHAERLKSAARDFKELADKLFSDELHKAYPNLEQYEVYKGRY